MKTKYNEIANKNYERSTKQSYVKSLLSKEVDYLLASSDSQFARVNFDDIYIDVPDAELYLKEVFKAPNVDKILYLVGMTGTGKSMILKKVFQTFTLIPHIVDKTLIIPFSFDNYLYNYSEESVEKALQSIFSSTIDSACELIESKFNNLKKAEVDYNDFFESIKTYKGGIAQKIDEFPRPTIEKRLKHLAKNNPLAFYSSMLKYYMNQYECELNNVVLVIDDIEGLGEDNELIPISIAHRILTCLENRKKEKEWNANLVIGCRNYVYRLLVRNNFSPLAQKFESFPTPQIFYINNSPSLSSIIQKRYEAIEKKEKSEKWKNALSIVKYILLEIDSSIGELILNIEIRDIRNALTTLKELIYNKQWIQRDYNGNLEGAFSIDTVNLFSVTQANLIRALGMKESLVYCSQESLITNLLENTNETDLIKLLIIKYFVRLVGGNYVDWNSSFNLDEFYNKIMIIYDDKIILQKFEESVQYLILNRMLLRSFYQMQYDASPVSAANVEKVKNVYPSNAVIDLYKYFEKNSILFEMFVDDIWLDNDNRPINKRKFRGFNEDNYNVSLNYLDYLIEVEQKYIIMARNISENSYNLYIELFGKDFLTEYLLCGLEKSLNIFYKNDLNEFNTGKESAKNEFINKIQDLKNKIENFLRN